MPLPPPPAPSPPAVHSYRAELRWVVDRIQQDVSDENYAEILTLVGQVKRLAHACWTNGKSNPRASAP